MKLGFVGAGNMAGAIISGILEHRLMTAQEIGIFDANVTQMEKYCAAGHKIYGSTATLVEDCDYIVLAVKPQNFVEILPEVKNRMSEEKVLVSIAAGISAEKIKSAVGFDCKVVLVMPNTPFLLGVGATALAKVEPTTESEFKKVMEIFAVGGIVEEISADKMCEVIPVNASSPAFVYKFAQLIAENAEAHGIDGDTALRLFCQTLIGSAKMLTESGKTPAELVDMVCSKGGTTIAAMEALEKNGFSEAVSEAFKACIQRANALKA